MQMRVIFLAALFVSIEVLAATPVVGGYQEVDRNVQAGRSFNIFIDEQADPYVSNTVFMFGALNTYEADGAPVTYYFGGILERTNGRSFLTTGVFATASMDLFRPSGGSCFGCVVQNGISESIGGITLMWSDNRNVMVDVVTDELGTETMHFRAASLTSPLDQLGVGEWKLYQTKQSGALGLPDDHNGTYERVEFDVIEEYMNQDVIPIYHPENPLWFVSGENEGMSVWEGANGDFYAKRIVQSFGAGHYTGNLVAYRLLVTDGLIVGYGTNSCVVLPEEGEACSTFTDFGEGNLQDTYLVLRQDHLRWSCDPIDNQPNDLPNERCYILQQRIDLP